MKHRLKRLKRQAVLDSLEKGVTRATLLLMECKTLKESDTLVSFLSNASVKMMEIKYDKHLDDVDMKYLFGERESLVHKLKDKANVSTVQDLLVSDLSAFRAALKHGKLPFQEILYAMRPVVIGSPLKRRIALSNDQSED